MKLNSSERTGLARALSKMGYCSRTVAHALIKDGRVRLKGRLSRDPETPVRLGRDEIEVDGDRVRTVQHVYLMMNKPRGVVTSARDEKGRQTVYSLMPENGRWLAPVGRLDKASEGLLLFTNDPAWAARITAPESRVSKTYHVQVRAIANADLLDRLMKGQHESGDFLRAERATLLRQGTRNCWIEIVLDEGRNRHIRRMFAALKIDVVRLVRVAIGGLELGALPKGAVRELTDSERQAIIGGKSR